MSSTERNLKIRLPFRASHSPIPSLCVVILCDNFPPTIRCSGPAVGAPPKYAVTGISCWAISSLPISPDRSIYLDDHSMERQLLPSNFSRAKCSAPTHGILSHGQCCLRPSNRGPLLTPSLASIHGHAAASFRPRIQIL
jgi:hypothetical protein